MAAGVPAYEWPRWLRDVLRFIPLRPQFIFSENVRDLQVCELAVGAIAALPLWHVLGIELRASRFGQVVGRERVPRFCIIERRGEDPAGRMRRRRTGRSARKLSLGDL